MLDTTRQPDSYDADADTTLSAERDFHENETSTYWLPKDEEEQLRLTGQHFAIKELYEGNILSSVAETLDLEKGISVLDVGCGSGVWSMDMASDYPNSTYEGCDIVAVTNTNVSQKQVSYSYGDVVKGLDYPDNSFDLVQMRLLILGLRTEEWPIAIKELIRVTKPGGMIQLMEVDFEVTGCDHPNVLRTSSTVIKSCIARGQDPYVSRKLKELIEQVGGAKVTQVDNRSVEMAANTSVAKKFLWIWKHTTTSMMPVLGPALGLPTAEDQRVYLEGMIEGVSNSKTFTNMFAVAAQKL